MRTAVVRVSVPTKVDGQINITKSLLEIDETRHGKPAPVKKAKLATVARVHS
jgi:hypothetical protein